MKLSTEQKKAINQDIMAVGVKHLHHGNGFITELMQFAYQVKNPSLLPMTWDQADAVEHWIIEHGTQGYEKLLDMVRERKRICERQGEYSLAQKRAKQNAMNTNDNGIHPSPNEFSADEIAQDPILRFFHYSHLPQKLQETSAQFCFLARHVVNTLPRNAERTVALRKLLESKDAAVRANLPAT